FEISNSKLVEALSRRLPQIRSVMSLSAEPKAIHLAADARWHGVLISAQTAEGFEVDVTDRVRFSTSRRAPFEVTELGAVHALRPGAGTLIASFGRQHIEIPVKIEARSGGNSDSSSVFEPPPVSFLRDVLPALSKAGCNAGA